MVDILPGPPVAKGKWETIGDSHLLIRMPDGNVLDWDRDTGDWRLFPYDPSNAKDVLPGPAINSGTWPSIVGLTRFFITLKDGRVLDWESSTGDWRLLEYNPKKKKGEIFSAVASGNWSAKAIQSTHDESIPTQYMTHRLFAMSGGNVLDWGPQEQGKWRLWGYDGTQNDVLTSVLKQGQWPSITGGKPNPPDPSKPAHRLHTMFDGRVLDWKLDDDSYRLWDYDPKAADVLPSPPFEKGQWLKSKWGWGANSGPSHFVAMQDGRVLAWVTTTGEWSLWEYGPLLVDSGPGPRPTPLRLKIDRGSRPDGQAVAEFLHPDQEATPAGVQSQGRARTPGTRSQRRTAAGPRWSSQGAQELHRRDRGHARQEVTLQGWRGSAAGAPAGRRVSATMLGVPGERGCDEQPRLCVRNENGHAPT